MKKFKLLGIVVLISLLVALFFSACGESTPTASPSSPEPSSSAAPAPSADSPASQVEPIVIKYGGLFPDTHPQSADDISWMKFLEEKSGGRIKVEPYWGATLVSIGNSFSEISKGVADVGPVIINYGAAGFQFHDATSGFWYGISSRTDSLKWYKQIYEQIPAEKSQFNACKIILFEAGTPYHILSKKPIRTLEDLKGLTLKVPEGYHPAFKKLGAQPVTVPMSEAYTSLQKGILDGILAPWETYLAFNFDEVVKYTTQLEVLYPFPCAALNWDTYNNLPPDLQKIFDESVAYWQDLRLNSFEKNVEAGRQKGIKSGVEFITFSDADLVRLNDAFDSAASEVAASLDSQGLPGSEYLNTLKDLKAAAAK